MELPGQRDISFLQRPDLNFEHFNQRHYGIEVVQPSNW